MPSSMISNISETENSSRQEDQTPVPVIIDNDNAVITDETTMIYQESDRPDLVAYKDMIMQEKVRQSTYLKVSNKRGRSNKRAEL